VGKVVVDKYIIFKKCKPLGEGSEGQIYPYGKNEVIKIFTIGRSLILKNKLMKVKRLMTENIKGYEFPKDVAVDIFDDFVGYTMNRVFTSEKIESLDDLQGDLFYDMQFPLSTKAGYLIKLEPLLKSASDKGIYYVDIKGKNILIDRYDQLHNVDTDCCIVDQYGADCSMPYLSHYQNNVSEHIDENTVKYIFGIFVLQFLAKDLHVYNRIEDDLRTNRNSLPEMVRSLDIGEGEKDVFLELFSDTKDKQYLGQILHNFAAIEDTRLRLKK
jgi:serine/threonine protein kinase